MSSTPNDEDRQNQQTRPRFSARRYAGGDPTPFPTVELLARPAERDYRHKLPDIHHRIDMLDRAGKKSRFISLRRFAAAAALLALVVCGEYLFLRSRYERAPSVCLVTARGSKSEFTLPDGTRVWLNGDSRLSYPEMHVQPSDILSDSLKKNEKSN